jgi:hypothetical protein
MAMRKGAAKGTGRGYRNLRGFPKDPIVHRDSGMGRKQPQRIKVNMTGDTFKKGIESFKSRPILYERMITQRIDRIDKKISNLVNEIDIMTGTSESDDQIYFALKKAEEKIEKLEKEKKGLIKKLDTDKDGVPDKYDCDPNDPTRQDIEPFRRRELYESKESRDKRFRELKAKYGDKFKKRRSVGQILHPMYVKDYKGEIDTGIGNVQYRTMFPVLYRIELKYGYTEADL